MKILKHISITLFFVFMGCVSFAQTKTEINRIKHYTAAVDKYLHSLNEKDLEGILTLYAENATVEDPVGSEVVEGMRAIRNFYSGAVTMDLKLKRTGAVRIASNEAAFPFELEMEVNGKLLQTEIIDVFRFDEAGKIISMRAYWGPSNQSEVKEE